MWLPTWLWRTQKSLSSVPSTCDEIGTNHSTGVVWWSTEGESWIITACNNFCNSKQQEEPETFIPSSRPSPSSRPALWRHQWVSDQSGDQKAQSEVCLLSSAHTVHHEKAQTPRQRGTSHTTTSRLFLSHRRGGDGAKQICHQQEAGTR